jgi:DNA-binding LacI/PurR family transcriptional regulator
MNIIGVAATVSGYATNYYFVAVLSGIFTAATERGQGVTVFSVPPGEPGAQTFQEFCDGRIDGLILVAPYVVDSLLVPKEISVIGFDDAPVAQMTRPMLTIRPFREPSVVIKATWLQW